MRGNGRGGLVDWTATSHDDEAAAAGANIDGWLAGRPAERDAAAWEATFGALRDGLGRLMSAPLVQGDAPCREILGRLDRFSTIEDIDAAMAALGSRIAALTAPAPAAAAPAPPAAEPVPAPGRRRAGLLRSLLRL